MNRLFGSDGKCVEIALDHGSHNQRRFLEGLEKFDDVLHTVASSGPDAILLTAGQAPSLQRMRLERKPSLVLRCDLTNIYTLPAPKFAFCEMIKEPVEQALRLDAAAVLLNLFFVPQNPVVYHQCITNVCEIKSACERYDMPLIVEPLILVGSGDTGGYDISGDLEDVKALVRQAVELGADVIKADPTDSIERYRELVEVAGQVPLLPRGGGKVSEQEIIERTHTLMEAGAAGVVYGRNIFQHENIISMVRAIRAIVHENGNVLQALGILSETN